MSANTAYGENALAGNKGIQNSGFGTSTIQASSNGNYNSAVGAFALANNTGGSSNTALGTNALLKNTSGDYNVALGTANMCFNTTGIKNTSIGSNTLENNTTGHENVAIGTQSLYDNIGGYQNTAIGVNTLYGNTGGYNNTAIGFEAGFNNTTGSNNIFIGSKADNDVVGQFSNSIAIGNDVVLDGSNKIIIGSDVQTVSIQGALHIKGSIVLPETVEIPGSLTIDGTLTVKELTQFTSSVPPTSEGVLDNDDNSNKIPTTNWIQTSLITSFVTANLSGNCLFRQLINYPSNLLSSTSMAISANDGTYQLYVDTSDTLHLSTNKGMSWSTPIIPGTTVVPFSICISETGQYIAISNNIPSNQNLLLSVNYGVSFSYKSYPNIGKMFTASMSYTGQYFLAISSISNVSQVVVSNDNFNTFTQVPLVGINNFPSSTLPSLVCVSKNGKYMYCLYVYNNAIYGVYSSEYGQNGTWVSFLNDFCLNGITPNPSANSTSLSISGMVTDYTGQYIYISYWNIINNNRAFYILYSHDYGNTFYIATSIVPSTFINADPPIYKNSLKCSSSGKFVFLTLTYSGKTILYSLDYGVTFSYNSNPAYLSGGSINCDVIELTKNADYAVTSYTNSNLRSGYNYQSLTS